jgi:hypothetical protein
MPKSLGEELNDALTNITALIIKTESKKERTKLTQQQATIAGQLQVFIDNIVKETLPEYKAATESLNAANAEAEKAKKKLDNISTAIAQFAKAIGKLGALAAKIA